MAFAGFTWLDFRMTENSLFHFFQFCYVFLAMILILYSQTKIDFFCLTFFIEIIRLAIPLMAIFYFVFTAL